MGNSLHPYNSVTSLLFVLATVKASTVIRHSNANGSVIQVKEGDLANFSCTVPCPEFGVKWFQVGIDLPIDDAGFGLNVTKQIPQSETCINGEWTYFLGVLATRAANNTVIYCAAHSREIPTESPDVHCGCGCPGTDRCYSRPSLLTVEPTEDTETTPSPSPSFTSSCTPSLQNIGTPEVIATPQVTVTPPVITVTTIQTQTITYTPNPTPAGCTGTDACRPTISSAQAASSQAVILTGLGIIVAALLTL